MGRLVNEGTVEEIQGVFVKVKSMVPGDGWHRTHEVFSTRDELTRSAVYSSRYFENQARQQARQQSMLSKVCPVCVQIVNMVLCRPLIYILHGSRYNMSHNCPYNNIWVFHLR